MTPTPPHPRLDRVVAAPQAPVDTGPPRDTEASEAAQTAARPEALATLVRARRIGLIQ